MNISFSFYTQFKSKLGKLGLCVSGARCWGMHRGTKTKRVLQDTDLKNLGWPRPKKDKPSKDQISRPKPQAKDRNQSQSQTPKSKNKDKYQRQRLKTGQVLGLG